MERLKGVSGLQYRRQLVLQEFQYRIHLMLLMLKDKKIRRILPITQCISELAHSLLEQYCLKYTPTPRRDRMEALICDMFIAATALKYKLVLFTQNLSHFLGRRVLAILENVETLPPPRQNEECEKSLAHKEPKEFKATRDWADKICRRFLFVERIEDIGWSQGKPKVRQELPNRLIVYLPGRQISGIGFRLTTTSQTDGQLRRATQEVERWITKEIDL